MEEVLGKPAHERTLEGVSCLYYGLHDSKAWSEGADTEVTLPERGQVTAVSGNSLTDSRGLMLLRLRDSETRIANVLGRRDWVQFSGCGSDINEYHYYKCWKLIVSVDRKDRIANEIVLEKRFPAEPPDGEMNVQK